MATSRWVGNAHFWDYSADRPEQYPGMDAYHTGDVYIYNDKGVANGIVTIMTGDEELKGVKLADAIEQARKFLADMARPGLPGSPVQEAKTLKQSQTFLFTWNGQKMR